MNQQTNTDLNRAATLTDPEPQIYERQRLTNGIGDAGQQRLKGASVVWVARSHWNSQRLALGKSFWHTRAT